MRILHIEEGFLPDTGYQINLLAKYMSLAGHSITILSTDLEKIVDSQKVYLSDNPIKKDELFKLKYGIEIIRIPVVRVISGRCQWDRKVFKLIRELHSNIDIIFFHGNDSLISMQYLVFHLRKINIPIIFDSHMLAEASRNPFAKYFRIFYKRIITPIIIRNKIPVIKVVDDPFVNIEYNIPEYLTPFISLGSDAELFVPDLKIRQTFRNDLNLNEDDFVVVYAGKLSEDKEGLFFANSIIKDFFGSVKRIVFLIVGNCQGEYGKRVEEIFLNSDNKIIRFPLQEHNNLPKFFQVADLGVIPFAASLTFYDMQACGLPVLWSDISINRKRTSNNAFLFRNLDIDDFRRKLIEITNINMKDYKNYRSNSRNFIESGYSYEVLTKQYIAIMEEELVKRKILGNYRNII